MWHLLSRNRVENKDDYRVAPFLREEVRAWRFLLKSIKAAVRDWQIFSLRLQGNSGEQLKLL